MLFGKLDPLRSTAPWIVLILLAPLEGWGLETRPNVVVLMTDDLDVESFAALRALGLMPNFERYVAEAGIEFEESYVTNAICCPSRASFLSGQYSHNHETFTNTFLNGSVTVFEDEDRLPSWLEESGYRTIFVGKYLNGYGSLHQFRDQPLVLQILRAALNRADPRGARRLESSYRPPGWTDWKGLVDFSTYCMYNFTVNDNGSIRTYFRDGRIVEDGALVDESPNPEDSHNYQTDVLTELARTSLREAEKKDGDPFFLFLNPLAPHAENCRGYELDGPQNRARDYPDLFAFTVRPAPRHEIFTELLRNVAASTLPLKPSFNEEDLTDKPEELQSKLPLLSERDQENLFLQYAQRMASMLSVDELLGDVVSTLKALGEWESTIFVFTSDNGWFNGEHRLSQKSLAYRESIRVPLFVRVPGRTRARRRSEIVLNNDWAPTLAELARARPSYEPDGRSIVPLLQDRPLSKHRPWRRRFLVEHFLGTGENSRFRLLETMSSFAVSTGATDDLPNRIYIESFEGIQRSDGYYLSPEQPEPSGRWIWQQAAASRELYELDADPFELDNRLHALLLRPERQRILQERRRLSRWLAELRRCRGRGCSRAESRAH